MLLQIKALLAETAAVALSTIETAIDDISFQQEIAAHGISWQLAGELIEKGLFILIVRQNHLESLQSDVHENLRTKDTYLNNVFIIALLILCSYLTDVIDKCQTLLA